MQCARLPSAVARGVSRRPDRAAAAVALPMRAACPPPGLHARGPAATRAEGRPGGASRWADADPPTACEVEEDGVVCAPVDEVNTSGSQSPAVQWAATAASLGTLYAADLSLKQLFLQQGLTFPAPLAGMFVIIAVLLGTARASGDAAAERIVDAFRPGLDWLARWLPLFYVPSLVLVPLAIRAVPGDQLGRIGVVLVVGMVASLVATAQAAVAIRRLTKTSTLATAPAKPKPAFGAAHCYAWAGAAAASLAAAAAGVPGLGALTPASAFMLSATVGGHLLGSSAPAGVRAVLHPVLTMALTAVAGAQVLAAVAPGASFDGVLGAYLAKGAGPMGAGDLLMSFLGCVILSFGFRIFEQRAIMRRHFAEIMGGCFISALFGMVVSALAGRAVGLAPELTLALVPRSITVALALPIAQQLQATQLSVTATCVVLTGLLGASCAQAILDKMGQRDPIVRGMATAGSSHGLGTAALAAKEPEALPYCALAYAVIGIMATVLASLGPVRAFLQALCGV